MNIHFIAIGGSAMHNLAIALHLKGYKVTGSDDEIFDPAKSRLEKYGLLPKEIGWNTANINSNVDAIILGMHARIDNPELMKVKEMGMKIYSYPEFLYEQSKNKIRVVIGGSHGKTSITAMILHAMEKNNRKCDYMVGAQLAGFEVMVKLTETAPCMILEGDEYLTSPIDRRPKFHVYQPDIALINGIAWDHINVFPTFDNYIEQFRIFANLITPKGKLIYYSGDEEVDKIGKNHRKDVEAIAYNVPEHSIDNGTTSIIFQDKKYPLAVFGKHNLQNIAGAWQVCKQLGLTDDEFLTAIQSFQGASKRLELVAKNDVCAVYKDFAHSPSKLQATVQAVQEQFPNRKLVACMELHTFSSLTEEFLLQYKGSFGKAETAIVYFNPHTIEHKKLPPITIEMVKKAFAREDIQVFNDSKILQEFLLQNTWKDTNLLLMSSGNFDGINEKELAGKIL